MSCLPKPVLRGFTRRAAAKALITAFSFAGINCTLYYFFVKVARERAYEEFYKSYDADAHFADLVKWGYIQTPIKH